MKIFTVKSFHQAILGVPGNVLTEETKTSLLFFYLFRRVKVKYTLNVYLILPSMADSNLAYLQIKQIYYQASSAFFPPVKNHLTTS